MSPKFAEIHQNTVLLYYLLNSYKNNYVYNSVKYLLKSLFISCGIKQNYLTKI